MIMIITSIALSDSASDDNDLSPDVSLILASHTVEWTAKLICCSWLAADECWQDKIKLKALAKHYKFDEQFDGSGIKFIPLQQLAASNREQQLLLTATAQLQQYLQGLRQSFDLPLDITLGTPFQQQVWQALQAIDYGETISYKTLAERVNSPKGYRAVANANSKNPLSIFIPCHRVIASDGKLGGYTGGLDKKVYLLAIEGVACKI
jgi:methylated-DNA-[protein]-cysteine S-methyltransferase